MGKIAKYGLKSCNYLQLGIMCQGISQTKITIGVQLLTFATYHKTLLDYMSRNKATNEVKIL